MTNRERELASLGFEYAEGIEYAEVIIIPGTGREIRKGVNEHGNAMWEVQPWNDNYWLHFDDLLEAIKCGTSPFEQVDKDTLVVRNVKQCDLCHGPVDRFCSTHPDKHVIYSTKYFECRKCHAMGDTNTGIMVQL